MVGIDINLLLITAGSIVCGYVAAAYLWHCYLKKKLKIRRERKKSTERYLRREIKRHGEYIASFQQEKIELVRQAHLSRLGHLSPGEKEQKIMDHRQYAAVMNNNCSKWFDTEEGAVKWAKEQMNQRTVDKVVIVKSIAVAKRPAPDIVVLPLMNKPEEEYVPIRHPIEANGQRDHGDETRNEAPIGAGFRNA